VPSSPIAAWAYRDRLLIAPSMAELLRLTSEGRLRPIIGQTFPLDQAAEAHRRLGQRETFGKLLLLPKSIEG
jgi:NADPH:quinone reductase-like Zn-dependent oxidoreductase